MKIQFWHKRDWGFIQEFYIPLEENFPEIEWVFPHMTPDTKIISEESLKTVDLFLAEVSDSATGLGIELGLAKAYGKKIICMYKWNTLCSKSIEYVTKDIIEYNTEEDMIVKLRKLFSENIQWDFRINFRKIQEADLIKIYNWRNKSHMLFWDKDGISLETVKQKYKKRITREDVCKCYIASFDWNDFWLIQYYRNSDEPEYAREIWIYDWVSLDLFIGEERFLGKGFWKRMLWDFTKKIFKDNHDITSIYICHEVTNTSAIKCSQSVWFQFLKDTIEDWKPSKLFIKKQL